MQISACMRRAIERIKKRRYLDAKGHISKVTPLQLKRELKKAGFAVESLRYGAFNPYIFPPYFLIFRELKFINMIYKLLDKVTNFGVLPIFKWDVIIKARKVRRGNQKR